MAGEGEVVDASEEFAVRRVEARAEELRSALERIEVLAAEVAAAGAVVDVERAGRAAEIRDELTAMLREHAEQTAALTSAAAEQARADLARAPAGDVFALANTVSRSSLSMMVVTNARAVLVNMEARGLLPHGTDAAR